MPHYKHKAVSSKKLPNSETTEKFKNNVWKHTLNWVGAEGGVYFFWTSGGGLRVGTGFDTEGGYRGGTLSKKKFLNGPKRPN